MSYTIEGDKVEYPIMGDAVKSLTRLRFSLSADPSQPDYFLVATRGSHKIGLKYIGDDKGPCQAVPITPDALEFLFSEIFDLQPKSASTDEK